MVIFFTRPIVPPEWGPTEPTRGVHTRACDTMTRCSESRSGGTPPSRSHHEQARPQASLPQGQGRQPRQEAQQLSTAPPEGGPHRITGAAPLRASPLVEERGATTPLVEVRAVWFLRCDEGASKGPRRASRPGEADAQGPPGADAQGPPGLEGPRRSRATSTHVASTNVRHQSGGRPPLRRDACWMASQSSRIRASRFVRDQPWIFFSQA